MYQNRWTDFDEKLHNSAPNGPTRQDRAICLYVNGEIFPTTFGVKSHDFSRFFLIEISPMGKSGQVKID